MIYAAIYPFIYGKAAEWNKYALGTIGVIMLLQYVIFIRAQLRIRKTHRQNEDEHLSPIISYINNHPQKESMRIVCFPTSMCEKIVYICRVAVLWGTHGFGFKTAEEFFPVLKKPFEKLMSEYQLTHCIIDQRYIKSIPFDRKFTIVHSAGPLVLYALE